MFFVACDFFFNLLSHLATLYFTSFNSYFVYLYATCLKICYNLLLYNVVLGYDLTLRRTFQKDIVFTSLYILKHHIGYVYVRGRS